MDKCRDNRHTQEGNPKESCGNVFRQVTPSHGSHDEVTERSDLSFFPHAISSRLTSDHAPWPTLHMVQWCMEPGLCHFPGNTDKCKFLLTAGSEDCHQESYTNFHSSRKVSLGKGEKYTASNLRHSMEKNIRMGPREILNRVINFFTMLFFQK